LRSGRYREKVRKVERVKRGEVEERIEPVATRGGLELYENFMFAVV